MWYNTTTTYSMVVAPEYRKVCYQTSVKPSECQLTFVDSFTYSTLGMY